MLGGVQAIPSFIYIVNKEWFPHLEQQLQAFNIRGRAIDDFIKVCDALAHLMQRYYQRTQFDNLLLCHWKSSH
jgi:hypothetical protein